MIKMNTHTIADNRNSLHPMQSITERWKGARFISYRNGVIIKPGAQRKKPERKREGARK